MPSSPLALGVTYSTGYRIADNFRVGLIFVIFVTALTVMKFTPHENFATAGKRSSGKVAASVHAIVVKTHGICLQSVESVIIEHSMRREISVSVTLVIVIGRFAC